MKKLLSVLISLLLVTGNTFTLAEENTVEDKPGNDPEIVEPIQEEPSEEKEKEQKENEGEEINEDELDTDNSSEEVSDGQWHFEEWVNPYYEDLVVEEPSSDLLQNPLPFNSTNTTYTTVSDAVSYLKEEAIKHTESVSMAVEIQKSEAASWSELLHTVWETCYEHDSSNPQGGDYIYWHVKSVSLGYYGSETDTQLSGQIRYNFTFLSNAEQEAAVTAKLNELIPTLNIGNGTDGEKATAIYTYLCNNVTYDYEHLSDDTYILKHSAYAALINGTSVCQGYALLFYRMALMMGLDSRMITGDNHAWNIVKIGDLYYLLDATWDSEMNCAKLYKYYFRGNPNFTGHYPESKYTTEPFTIQYPLSQTDYVFPDSLKVAATGVSTVPASISISGIGNSKTAEIVVEPKETYDKSFSTELDSSAFSSVVSYNSRTSKNYILTVTSNAYGTGNVTIKVNGLETPYNVALSCTDPSALVSYTVNISNEYTGASAGVNYIALYSSMLSDDDIKSDINGSREDSLYTADGSGNQVSFTEIQPATYKLATYKNGYITKIQTVEISSESDPATVSLRALGDATNDGKVDVSDIILIRDIILGEAKARERMETDTDLSTAADVNKDSRIDVSDIILVRDRILGVVDENYEKKS